MKGLCEDSLGPETSTKIPDQKTHRPEVKETHLLTLEHLREKLGQLGLSGGTETPAAVILLSHSAMLILVDAILESAF